MDTLKKFFPYSFGTKDVRDLVIKTIIYAVIGLVVAFLFGFLGGLLGSIPGIGLIFKLLGSVVDLYITAGIVLMFLAYFKVLK